MAGLLIAVALAGCADGDGDSEGDVPTSAECLERGLILNATAGPDGGPACVEPPFVVRSFEDPNHHCVVNRFRDRVHAPDLVGDPWVLGQFWEYSLAVDGEDLGTTKLVYYDDQDLDSAGVAQHYMVGTPTREEALRHAIFSENPMIGRVHRILYSPHESGDHADMFHFPLCPGSSWQTVFYGETFTLTAQPANLALPNGGSDDGFAIEGASAEGSTLRLSYSPAAQWFTFIDLDRADGGTVDMELVDTGTGYTGEAFFLRGQKDEFASLQADTAMVASIAAAPVHTSTIARADGDEGPYDTVGIRFTATMNGTGYGQATLIAPNGAQRILLMVPSPNELTTTRWSREVIEELPFQAGDWTLELSGVSLDPEAAATITTELTMVSIYDRSGAV